MAKEIHYKATESEWVETEDMFYKKNGIWLTIKSAYYRKSDEWEQIFRRVNKFTPDVSLSILKSDRSGPGDRVRSGDTFTFNVNVEDGGHNEASRVGFVRFLLRYNHLNPAVSTREWSQWKSKHVDNTDKYQWSTIFDNNDKEAASGDFGKRVEYEVKAQVITEKDSDVFVETDSIKILVDDFNKKPNGSVTLDTNKDIYQGDSFDLIFSSSDDFGVDTVQPQVNYTPNQNNEFTNIIGTQDRNGEKNPSDQTLTVTEAGSGIFDYRAKIIDIQGRVKETATQQVEILSNDSPNLVNANSGVTSKWEIVEKNISKRTFEFYDESGIDKSNLKIENNPNFITLFSKEQINSNKAKITAKFAPNTPQEGSFDVKATDQQGETFSTNIKFKALSANEPPVLPDWGDKKQISKSITLNKRSNSSDTNISFDYTDDGNEVFDSSNVSVSVNGVEASYNEDEYYDHSKSLWQFTLKNTEVGSGEIVIITSKYLPSSTNAEYPDEGNYLIQITLTDNEGASITKEVSLNLSYPNLNPYFQGYVGGSASENDLDSLYVFGGSDILTFDIENVFHPSVVNFVLDFVVVANDNGPGGPDQIDYVVENLLLDAEDIRDSDMLVKNTSVIDNKFVINYTLSSVINPDSPFETPRERLYDKHLSDKWYGWALTLPMALRVWDKAGNTSKEERLKLIVKFNEA